MNTTPAPLYISDLDGTLLTANAELAPSCRDGLRGLLEDGLVFTIASARSHFSIRQIVGDLPITLPVVNFNGAFLTDLESGRHELVNAIERPVVEEILRLIPEFGCLPFLSAYNGEKDLVYWEKCVNEGMEWHREDRLRKKDPRWRKTDNLANVLNDQTTCITVIAREEELTDLRALLAERFSENVQINFQENSYSPGWFWLTIHDVRATKDRAIAQMKERYGLSESRLVVFGDQMNDLKMFQLADHAVAVANAVSELKEHADEVIGHHTEGSVVRYLQNLPSHC